MYQKDDELRRRINSFLQQTFELPENDYYAKLNAKSLLLLKSALSDVNNALTMKLTFGFLNWAEKALPIDSIGISMIRANVRATKPSSNGFDISCTDPIPFVAEVNCNIPINGGKIYGSAQRNGIIRDITSLLEGKAKALGTSKDSLKFMVFLDLPEIRAANDHLIRSNTTLPKAFRILGTDEYPCDPALVYGVHVALGD